MCCGHRRWRGGGLVDEQAGVGGGRGRHGVAQPVLLVLAGGAHPRRDLHHRPLPARRGGALGCRALCKIQSIIEVKKQLLTRSPLPPPPPSPAFTPAEEYLPHEGINEEWTNAPEPHQAIGSAGSSDSYTLHQPAVRVYHLCCDRCAMRAPTGRQGDLCGVGGGSGQGVGAQLWAVLLARWMASVTVMPGAMHASAPTAASARRSAAATSVSYQRSPRPAVLWKSHTRPPPVAVAAAVAAAVGVPRTSGGGWEGGRAGGAAQRDDPCLRPRAQMLLQRAQPLPSLRQPCKSLK